VPTRSRRKSRSTGPSADAVLSLWDGDRTADRPLSLWGGTAGKSSRGSRIDTRYEPWSRVDPAPPPRPRGPQADMRYEAWAAPRAMPKPEPRGPSDPSYGKTTRKQRNATKSPGCEGGCGGSAMVSTFPGCESGGGGCGCAGGCGGDRTQGPLPFWQLTISGPCGSGYGCASGQDADLTAIIRELGGGEESVAATCGGCGSVRTAISRVETGSSCAGREQETQGLSLQFQADGTASRVEGQAAVSIVCGAFRRRMTGHCCRAAAV
jgi:hypothetical protein